VEEVNERKGPSLDQYPVLSEFQNVFSNELPGLPLERELDFTIELKPGAEPISDKGCQTSKAFEDILGRFPPELKVHLF